ncbi:MAG TPA: hypothetical protein VHE37_09235 [Nevskiaceae bacterium]|nr:hypothetical protein [Nevskiaceae bacterium]
MATPRNKSATKAIRNPGDRRHRIIVNQQLIRLLGRQFSQIVARIDELERELKAIPSDLSDPANKEAFQKKVENLSGWMRYYRLPLSIHLLFFVAQVGATALLVDFDAVKMGQRSRLFDETLASFMAIQLSIRSLILNNTELRTLLRQALSSEKAFLDAVRIDPTVLADKRMVARLSQYTLAQDAPFMRRLSSVLAQWEPAKNKDGALLRTMVYLLYRTGLLYFFNEETLFHLFAKEMNPPLYSARGRKDARASLWRNVQRWKREWATRIP